MGECKNHQECMKDVYEKIEKKLDRVWFTTLIFVLLTVIGGLSSYTNNNLSTYAEASAEHTQKTNESMQEIKLTVNSIAIEQKYMKEDIKELKKKVK